MCTASAVMATEKIDLNIKRIAASLKYLVVTQNKLMDSMGHLLLVVMGTKLEVLLKYQTYKLTSTP